MTPLRTCFSGLICAGYSTERHRTQTASLHSAGFHGARNAHRRGTPPCFFGTAQPAYSLISRQIMPKTLFLYLPVSVSRPLLEERNYHLACVGEMLRPRESDFSIRTALPHKHQTVTIILIKCRHSKASEPLFPQ